MTWWWKAAAALTGAVGSAALSAPVSAPPPVTRPAPSRAPEPLREPSAPTTSGHATRKAADAEGDDAGPGTAGRSAGPHLGTLVQLHTDERTPLDRATPSAERFDALLADRATGASHRLDPRLLGLIRQLAERHPGARFELVSGFRSPKLNEMLRKKGHNVASHSQHSLGHACDFRLVLPGETKGMDPRALEKEIRGLGWDGGVGVYTSASDWFVHADVGKNRHWRG